MRMLFRCLTAIVLSVGLAQFGAAAPILTLSSTPANLTNLTPGQVITVHVELTGLTDPLAFLGVTVGYDGNLLSGPIIAPGPIVPNADADHFLTAAFPGIADASYDANPPAGTPDNPITGNGVFFSFDVTVLARGSGTFTFGFVDAVDPSGAPVNVIPGPDLDFVIPSATGVPEPSTLWLCATGLAAWAMRRRLNRTVTRRC